MAEEQGDNKALEVIPLFFFDLIARVIPGLFLLFGVSLISGRLASLIKESIPDKVLDSAASLLSLALLAGYVVGHLISLSCWRNGMPNDASRMARRAPGTISFDFCARE